MSQQRIGFVERAIGIREDIKQIFLDADYWNKNVRKSGEEPIDPDPQGELKNILAALEKFIGPQVQ